MRPGEEGEEEEDAAIQAVEVLGVAVVVPMRELPYRLHPAKPTMW